MSILSDGAAFKGLADATEQFIPRQIGFYNCYDGNNKFYRLSLHPHKQQKCILQMIKQRTSPPQETLV